MWACERRVAVTQKDQRCQYIASEQGVAMLVVLLVMVMMTVLGVAAITVSGLENKMSGLQRTMESASQAAESCLGTGANIITQTQLPENGGQIPPSFLNNATPAGPVPSGIKASLEDELRGTVANSTDDPLAGSPNLRMTVGAFSVVGDIDFLLRKQMSGGPGERFDQKGTIGSGALLMYYKIDCVSTLLATGTESRVSAIYLCATSSDGCVKQL